LVEGGWIRSYASSTGSIPSKGDRDDTAEELALIAGTYPHVSVVPIRAAFPTLYRGRGGVCVAGQFMRSGNR
jgi:hypothetical protein